MTTTRRLLLSLSVIVLVSGIIATPPVSAQQSFNLYVGGFAPRSEDARGTDDVLFQNGDFLSFDLNGFNGPTAGAEWLVALGDHFDAGLGVGAYSRSVPSVYTRQINRDGSEIEQDLKLRIVPLTATFRFLPLGHHGPIEPYIGGGVGVNFWRYSETGQFVDFTDSTIYRDSFVASGTTAGPVILGGVRIPIGAVGLGGEIRYQSGEGTLPPDLEFAGPKIDLGGLNYLLVVSIRF